jgi:hypothetical protein
MLPTRIPRNQGQDGITIKYENTTTIINRYLDCDLLLRIVAYYERMLRINNNCNKQVLRGTYLILILIILTVNAKPDLNNNINNNNNNIKKYKI